MAGTTRRANSTASEVIAPMEAFLITLKLLSVLVEVYVVGQGLKAFAWCVARFVQDILDLPSASAHLTIDDYP